MSHDEEALVSFTVRVEPADLVVALGGVDRLLCWRREVRVPRRSVTAVRRAGRRDLEHRLDHRRSGTGPHRGDRRPGRRRVGTFTGRDVGGRPQFWAVSAGSDDVLVVDLAGGCLGRLVLDAHDAAPLARPGPGERHGPQEGRR